MKYGHHPPSLIHYSRSERALQPDPPSILEISHATAGSSDVQLGQRVASMAISETQ